MLNPRNPADGGNKIFPALPLGAKYFSPFWSQGVIAPPSLLSLLHPVPFDPTPLLQPVKQGVQGCDVKPQGAIGSELNQLGDVISVARPALKQRQHQKF